MDVDVKYITRGIEDNKFDEEIWFCG